MNRAQSIIAVALLAVFGLACEACALFPSGHAKTPAQHVYAAEAQLVGAAEMAVAYCESDSASLEVCEQIVLALKSAETAIQVARASVGVVGAESTLDAAVAAVFQSAEEILALLTDVGFFERFELQPPNPEPAGPEASAPDCTLQDAGWGTTPAVFPTTCPLRERS